MNCFQNVGLSFCPDCIAYRIGEHSGLVEWNTLHDQKVVNLNPASAGVLRPWARCFIPSCFTPPRCNNRELL